MDNVKVRSRLLMLVALVVGASGSFFLVKKVVLAQGRTPFTVALEEKLYDGSGKLTLSVSGVHAIRRDGSTARTRVVSRPANAGWVTQRVIVDLMRAEEVAVDEITQSLTTTPLRRDVIEMYQRSPACLDNTSEVRTLLGYRVVQHVETIGKREGRIMRKESWKAPALDCFPLKEMLWIGTTEENLRIATLKEASQVMQAEPLASLFERPQGYRERSPSQRSAEFFRLYPGESCPTCLQKSNAEADEIYYRRQADRGR